MMNALQAASLVLGYATVLVAALLSGDRPAARPYDKIR